MSLKNIFYPEAIAVVGASTKPNSAGNDIVKNLATRGYAGKIYPVNPKAEILYDLKCYPTMTAVGAKIDLAIIVIPAQFVPDALEECARLDIHGASIISAGFKEVGNFELENKVHDICVKNKIALIGPNCLGVINPEIKMNASFAMVTPDFGPVAFISQSGALCSSVLDHAKTLGIGFSKFISMGNKAVVNELGILDYLAEDPHTKVIAMYVEQLAQAQELIEASKKITHGKNPKPIIVLKSGRTSAGASASASHTGALAGNDAAYDALSRQSGILRANSVAELFEYIQIFTNNELPKGKNVAIVTNAGGPGVLTTDAVIENGLSLAKLDDKTVNELKAVMPPAANCNNPVDVLGDAKADRYEIALKAVGADENVDSIVVILTPQSMTEPEATAQAIARLRQTCKKPIAVSFIGDDTVIAGVKTLRDNQIASFDFPEEAAHALSALYHFQTWSVAKDAGKFIFKDTKKKEVAKIFAEAKAKGKTSFPEAEALKILELYSFPLLKSRVVTSPTEAEKVGVEIGKSLAMKIVSPDILHKSDVGGVMLNIDPKNVAEAYETMFETVKKNAPKAKLEGVLLVEMAPKGGAELILGANKDPNLGNMIMFGMGGIYVEVLKDVVFALAPITQGDAQTMLEKIRSKKIFEGVRGGAKLDKEATLDTLGRLSTLLTDFPEIKELDINPLLMLPEGQGVRVLDARIVIE